MSDPERLIKLAADLAKVGTELQAAGKKLAEAASTLEQEAANLAEEKSKQLRWGVHVAVNVQANGQPQSDFKWTSGDEDPKCSGALK